MLNVSVRLDEIGIRVGSRHAHGDALELAFQSPDLVESGQGLGQHRLRLASRHLLRQVTDAHPAVQMDPALIGLLDSGEYSAKRRLARAIRPDQSNALPAPDAPGALGEEALPSISLRNGVESDHPSSLSHRLDAVGQDLVGHAHLTRLAERIAVLAR